jgi:hypothetical protein
MKDKITTIEIEERIANYFGVRQCIIVPNISWGMNMHECDLLVVRRSGVVIEVEIKVSRSDLKKDLEKGHNHKDDRIKELYFAIPDYLENCIEFIPEHAGILSLSRSGIYGMDILNIKRVREPKPNPHHQKFSQEEILNVARLGTMRIWALKRKLINKKRARARKKIEADYRQRELYFHN